MDFDDEGDGLDEFIKAGTRQIPDEEFQASGRELPRVNKTGPGSTVTGPPIRKLEDERWTDHLGHNERRDVLLSAKAGDPAAKERLAKSFHKALIKIAGKAKYSGPPFDERLGAAWVGFWKAFKGWDPDRNNGFWAYAAKFVHGAVCDCVTNWHYRGLKDESRAARKERSEHRPTHWQYNGVEGSHYDLEGREPMSAPISGWIAADDHELRECDGSGGKVTDAAWDRIVAGRAVPTNWPNTWAPEEPCKPISRERYTEDHAQAHRFDTAAHAQQRLSQGLAKIGRSYGVPRECIGVDENPYRNGGRDPGKTRFPTRSVFSETAKVKFKDGKRRVVVRQKAASDTIIKDRNERVVGRLKAVLTLGKYASETGIPRWEGQDDGVRFALYAKGPVLGNKFACKALSSEYLAKYPTPDKHKIDAPHRGNAAPVGVIGYLANDADERALRRLKRVGRVQYAQELAVKDRERAEKRHAHMVPLFERAPASYSVALNTSATPVAAHPERVERVMVRGEIVWKSPPGPVPSVYDYRTESSPLWRRHEENQTAQLKIIEGLQNGKFNHPGTLNHAVHGNALHRHDRGRAGDVRKINRARS